MMNAIDALAWCRRHNGSIHFERDNTVTVIAYGVAKRGATLVDAMTALYASRDRRADLAAETVRLARIQPRTLLRRAH